MVAKLACESYEEAISIGKFGLAVQAKEEREIAIQEALNLVPLGSNPAGDAYRRAINSLIEGFKPNKSISFGSGEKAHCCVSCG